MELHRFFVAIARAAVNEDGCAGVALHPTVWSSGGLIKRRKVRVSAWEYVWVPGPVGLWRHGSVGWPCIEVRDVDVGFWPYSVGLLVKLCFFLSSLHWPSTVDDLGFGGVSFIELLILYERWAGERLVLEISVPKSRRLYRPVSVSAVPTGPSIDIWRSCRFLGAMLRALGGLPGGLGRFLPCRLAGVLDDLLSLFGYPSGSGQSLVDGSLRMRYCSTSFSRKKNTWRLPPSGGVAALVSVADVHPLVVGLSGSGDVSSFGNFEGGGRKKIRLTKKRLMCVSVLELILEGQPIPKRWKADTLRDVAFHGQEGGIFCSGCGLSHVSEPKGIG